MSTEVSGSNEIDDNSGALPDEEQEENNDDEYISPIKELTYDESFNYTTLTCMLVALHENSNNNKYIEYKEFIDKNIDFNELDDDTKEYLNALMYYLRHKDKKLLNKFNKYEIMGSLIPILKKIWFGH